MTTASSHFFHLSPTCGARGRLEECEHFFLQGNLNEALAAAQQAWREHPQEPDVFRILAYLHMSRGEYPPAAQAAYQAVLLDSENPASYATLAQVYLTFNMLNLAEETLNNALPRFPADPTLLTLSADVRFRRGKDGPAVEQVTLALQQNPQDGYAKALLGTHHLRKKHYSAARKLLADAVATYPNRWDYLRDYGIALVHTEGYEEAQRVLAQSFRLNPADLRAKQYLHLAFRLGGPLPSPYWRMAFFFYRNSGWGWLFNITGWLVFTIGFVWSFNAFMNWVGVVDDAYWPGGLLLSGLALFWLTAGGVGLTMKKGRRFDAYLSREIEQKLGAAGG